MEKVVLIVVVYLVSFMPTFGQEVVGYGTIAKVTASSWDFTVQDMAKLSEQKERVVFHRDQSVDFERADPNMPIAVPPKDLFSKFPIKKLPESFPSDMPILGPTEKSLGLNEGRIGDGDR